MLCPPAPTKNPLTKFSWKKHNTKKVKYPFFYFFISKKYIHIKQKYMLWPKQKVQTLCVHSKVATVVLGCAIFKWYFYGSTFACSFDVSDKLFYWEYWCYEYILINFK